MGKSSSHYVAQYIAFIGHSSNNEWIPRVYMQDFFRCEEGMEDRADLVATKVCKKLVKDLHYEARVQAVITYHGLYLRTKISKIDARTMMLTRQQYIEVNIEY
jgi:hypothetical protein